MFKDNIPCLVEIHIFLKTKLQVIMSCQSQNEATKYFKVLMLAIHESFYYKFFLLIKNNLNLNIKISYIHKDRHCFVYSDFELGQMRATVNYSISKLFLVNHKCLVVCLIL